MHLGLVLLLLQWYLVATAERFEFRDTADMCYLSPWATVTTTRRKIRNTIGWKHHIFITGCSLGDGSLSLPMFYTGCGTCGR